MQDILIDKKNDVLSELKKIDWDFSGAKTQYLSHKFHSYPARFIPQIPLTFINLFTKKNDLVLDPMCGCGTTLVESFLNERNAIGNDFNPLATLISKVKTTLISKEDFTCLEKKIFKLKDSLKKISKEEIKQEIKILPNRNLKSLFTESIISELISIKYLLQDLKKENKNDLYDFGKVAFSNTVWFITENEGVFNVHDVFMKKIHSMYKEISLMTSQINKNTKIKIINGDSRKLKVENECVDLIVTSPPYVNALDYYRHHMYSMHWLEMDYKIFKKNEIGGHSHFIMNRFRLLSEYLGDMFRSMIEINRVLKKGKFAAIVVGNSSLEYELMENHKYFSSFASHIGFKHHMTLFRNIDVTKKYTNDLIGQINTEHIVVLEKIDLSKNSSMDEDFIYKKVKEQMLEIKEKIKINPGSSITVKRPSKRRLNENIKRIESAIDSISEDIKLKK